MEKSILIKLFENTSTDAKRNENKIRLQYNKKKSPLRTHKREILGFLILKLHKKHLFLIIIIKLFLTIIKKFT